MPPTTPNLPAVIGCEIRRDELSAWEAAMATNAREALARLNPPRWMLVSALAKLELLREEIRVAMRQAELILAADDQARQVH